MYTLEDVRKRYGNDKSRVDALDGVDMTIGDAEFVVIQGPTGQGKSTLLQLLGGLDRPTGGTVSYDGRDLGSLSEAELTRLRAHAFGFVFQTFNLIPTLSAGENVETALVPLGVHGSERRERAVKALAEVGLDHRVKHLPGELSGGEQQRTAIARALVKEPRVILADEPTGNLDQDTRDEIVGLLEELWVAHGVTLVMVTHDDLVAARAPRRMRLEAGRMRADSAVGTPS
jgi:putative ABC transport system ATP-binding protein